MARRIAALALSAAATAALLAGCAGAAPDAPPAATSTPAPTRTADPTPTTSPASAPTCQTIITSSLVDTFAAQGWTFREEPFMVGDRTLDDGLSCTWGDFSRASDHVQIFGWAPATPEVQSAVRADLLTSGWRLIEEGGSTYLTADPKTAVSKDADGYGTTYQFGDGWIRVADTKQGLLLVEWPRG